MKKILSVVSAVAMVASAGMASIPVSAEREISYTEKVGTIENPAMGYTSTCWANCKPNATPTYNPTGSLCLFFIDIGAFSSGANGTTNDDGTYVDGIDYDLDDTFFNSWRTTFENCRKNGCMIALRFRYDANGKDKPEPATFDKVLDHVQQIKDSGILEDYKDIIAFVESGFVGKWGEQHGGKYTSVEDKAKLLDAMIDCVPSPIPVTVRTPDIFAKWVGIERKDLADYEATGEECRVGLYNDGYMGSDSDLGTFANRQIETDWLGNQTFKTYYGGEFSGNLDWAKKYDTYLPENAIPEMYKTHLSYINGNIFQLYKDYTFGEEYDTPSVDNSAYYGQSVFQFIRDHIGYRFVLRDSSFWESEVEQGDYIELRYEVANTGFANPIPETKAEIVLEQDGKFIRTPIDVDPNTWYSCTSVKDIIHLKLPDSIPVGEWNAYLKLSMGDNTVDQLNLRSIQFANEGIWDASLGANYVGSFTVTESEDKGTDNGFYQYSENSEPDEDSGRMYSITGQTTADGLITSPYEWTDDMLIAEDNGNKLYLTADDQYMYIMADIPNNAEKAVWNIRVENDDNGESYWYYKQSAGWIYYNHGDHNGITLKVNGNIAEWKIALGDVMGVSPNTKIKSVRVFVQDEANEWVNSGEIKSGECTVPAKFPVYSAHYEVRLSEGDSYVAKPEVFAENATYQWYLNGEKIDGTGAEYQITNADINSVGDYSVEVTANGVTAMIPVLTVAEVSGTLRGDINADGKVNVADMVLLEKYVLGSGSLTEKQYTVADLSGDKTVDSFDMVMMRKLLV